MEKNQKLIIGLAFFTLLLLVLTAYLTSTVRTLNGSVLELNKAVDTLEQNTKDLKDELGSTKFELDKLKGNVTIIDGAVNSEGKRKARIAKVKKLIVDVAHRDNLKEAQLLEPSQLAEMATNIVDRADAEHIPVALLLGLIRQESAFNPNAVSVDGAQGLTQVMPTTADDIKQWTSRSYYEPFRISHNIWFGAYYLGRMLRKFGWNKTHAVWAYNGGPEAVAKYIAGTKQLYPETIDYETRVMRFAREFESMGAY